MKTFPDINRLKATLDPAIVRGKKDNFVNMAAHIVKESFRPYFHALGLPREENP